LILKSDEPRIVIAGHRKNLNAAAGRLLFEFRRYRSHGVAMYGAQRSIHDELVLLNVSVA